MLPLNTRMILAGIVALSLGAVTGRIIFVKTAVEAAEPRKVARVDVPAIPSNADAPTQGPLLTPDPVYPTTPGRLSEASSTGSSAPAPVAEVVPPLRKAEAPATEEPARVVVPVREAPNMAAPKSVRPMGGHRDDDDDDDDDDPC
jgi:hypothetical protein